MIEKGAILVATQHVVDAIGYDPSLFDPASYKKWLMVRDRSREAYRTAVRLGVRVALGTDTGLSYVDHPLHHGNNAQELRLAVEVGRMTALEAIEACTATAPETLGRKAPRSGRIERGYDADLIGVEGGNPLDDVSVLCDPINIGWVWKGGVEYKKSGLLGRLNYGGC